VQKAVAILSRVPSRTRRCGSDRRRLQAVGTTTRFMYHAQPSSRQKRCQSSTERRGIGKFLTAVDNSRRAGLHQAAGVDTENTRACRCAIRPTRALPARQLGQPKGARDVIEGREATRGAAAVSRCLDSAPASTRSNAEYANFDEHGSCRRSMQAPVRSAGAWPPEQGECASVEN